VRRGVSDERSYGFPSPVTLLRCADRHHATDEVDARDDEVIG
jgi:hypothetical protein